MRANEKHALHDNDGGTHVNAHDFSSVDFTMKTNRFRVKMIIKD